ncbi:hypothetical protein JWZ98_03250 [Methylomonas sp. EFPC1]|uniref:OB-fold protein n=1 Tax=Methylomonas sp. EFPC1 TaxID=2812647 RepID=UPI001967AE6C|nr:hypothetical protein [Methylomonas sp. EFPC1]QSB01992.1 hypothetical protein JWZ98_03250 [Methylomonas sp. EFPC1]
MFKFIKWTVGIAFAAVIGLVILGSVIESNKTPEEKAADESRRQEQNVADAKQKQEQAIQEMASLPAYSANDLAYAYNENSVAADQKFKDKKFKVSGVISAINTDIFGNPYLTLKGGVNQFMEPQFSFDKDSIASIAKLKSGMKVNLVCTGKGDIAKTPMSHNCVLI